MGTIKRARHVLTGIAASALLAGGVMAGGGVAEAAAPARVAADTTPPPAPTGLQATQPASTATITLTWNKVTASDLAGYLVYRSDTTPVALDAAHLRSVATPFNALSFYDTPYPTGATYYYAVIAVDTSGNRSAPATLTWKSRDMIRPPAPTGVTGSIDPVARTYTVTWNPKAATDTDTVGYRLGSCSDDGICFVEVTSPPLTGTSVTLPWPGTSPMKVAVCAEDAAFLRTCSANAVIVAPTTTQ
ncbi:hypothetical protein ABZ848_46960 [Streptomyces sp. NPDC047081]|uniref:hypothetical protein n=1 Tax=Streptomyces sp. NPDC047081 TaxID=3154706 RepID=UPI0033DB457E